MIDFDMLRKNVFSAYEVFFCLNFGSLSWELFSPQLAAHPYKEHKMEKLQYLLQPGHAKQTIKIPIKIKSFSFHHFYTILFLIHFLVSFVVLLSSSFILLSRFKITASHQKKSSAKIGTHPVKF